MSYVCWCFGPQEPLKDGPSQIVFYPLDAHSGDGVEYGCSCGLRRDGADVTEERYRAEPQGSSRDRHQRI